MNTVTPTDSGMLRKASTLALASALVALGACSESTTPPTGTDVPVDAASFLSDSMPPWTAYSPPVASSPAMMSGAATTLPEVVVPEVEVVNEAGEIDTYTNQTYVCTETPYSVTETPRELIMYSPGAAIWAGALIQGQSHRDLNNLGNLRDVVVDERAPIKLAIHGVLGVPGDVRAEVPNPSLSAVTQAVNDLVGNATSDDLQTASDIDFQMRTYHSEEAVGLSLGASGRYLGFKAAASYDSNISQSETTVTAQFYETMFSITVDRPSTPAGFFTSALTGDVLRSKYRTTITPENPPLFVSKITYGRALMYSMTSTATESQMRAAMNASFKSIAGGASVNVSKRDSTLLAESKISVVALGGAASNVLNLIRTNNLAAYFEDGAPLTSARPLSYELSTLDGEVAAVTEITNYTVRTCAPKGTGGVTYLDPQTAPNRLSGLALSSVSGNFDGDEYEDILWNHLSGATNRLFIGHGTDGDSLAIGQAIDHPGAGGGIWGQYDLQVADLNGDGIDDLVWNALNATGNTTYTALADGNGGFTFPASPSSTTGNWTAWDPAVLGDFDGDGTTDIAWSLTGPQWSMVLGKGVGDGTFTIGSVKLVNSNTGYASYKPAVAANFDDDPAYEVVVQDLSSGQNASWVTEIGSNGEWGQAGVTVSAGNWSGSEHYVADLDGVHGSDIIFFNGNSFIAGFRANGNIGMGQSRFGFDMPNTDVLNPAASLAGYDLRVGDFDSNGRQDLIFNRLSGTSNDLVIAYGTSAFQISVPAGILSHQAPPTGGWDQYETHILDVNGDGKDDVVWTNPGSSLTVYIGLAR